MLMDYIHRPVFLWITTFRKLDLSQSSGRCIGVTLVQFGPVERANLDHHGPMIEISSFYWTQQNRFYSDTST
jgi:hypothetical protein